MSNILLESSPVSNDAVTVSIVKLGGTYAAVQYHTIVGNEPSTNADTLFIWEAGPGLIPYSKTPVAQRALTKTDQEGTFAVTGLTLGEKCYCLGLAVGPSAKNVVAAAFAVPSAQLAAASVQPLSCSLQLDAGTSTDTVLVKLTTPNGYLGNTWNSVVRLFSGTFAPLASDQPGQPRLLSEVVVPSNDPTNMIVFDGVSLATGGIYTVGFYSDAKSWTTVAATLTFTA